MPGSSVHGLPTAGAESGPSTDPDRDTVAAVEATLTAWLHQRAQESVSLDPAFGHDLVHALVSFVTRGGKRLRACFAWWGWRAAGGTRQGERAHAALRVASALELLQALALMHDDVMDGSRMRRGTPALHVDFATRHRAAHLCGSADAFGVSSAILAGDLALVWAEDMLADAGLDPATRRRVRPLWRSMRTEMVAGQYLDLRAQAVADFSCGTALHIAALKSAAYTVERPLGIGVAMAGADSATQQHLGAAARDAGLAFQLRDDMDGVFGDPSRTGKPSGDDVREGKVTYLAAVTRQLAEKAGDHRAVDVLTRCLGDAALGPEGLRAFREAVTAVGGRAAVEQEIGTLVGQSLRALAGADILPLAKARLGHLIETAARVDHTRRVPEGPGHHASTPGVPHSATGTTV